jgi:predicted TIM-barrel enzyme
VASARNLDLYLREADGVIVGSAIMQGGAGATSTPRARRFVATARKILD